MASAVNAQTNGFVALSRVVCSVAVDLVAGVERVVIGDGKVRTAQSNAWDAICADRAARQARADLDRLVADLLASGPPVRGGQAHAIGPQVVGAQVVGSSPRSSASHAALVSTGGTSVR
ncbi:hypothetical protein EV385_4895 [Krasilnikovia cinnamomea]|uniref:Uncharacterized protein n=1 Tax=Krasilnikovia cinnamomea TaxID=349313 RepID=A0A4Q7ZQI7_9ACTN|nr:hypothetical protein [Krasilnikovia cinnamomea]RZU53011.1 hypothetical protein EV385_4895 [Krasilnikovia cinnamomea]